MQSKKLSIIEAITNTITGLIVSFGIQILIYPFLNIEVSLNQNIFITIVFFIASFLRSYIIRRIFTKIKTL
jgi:high-affinity Fe2+/Pb2+ permease